MNCLRKVLLGATLLPLVVGALFVSLAGPAHIATQLGYDAMWGIPVTFALWGAACGGFSCWCDKQVERAVAKARGRNHA